MGLLVRLGKYVHVELGNARHKSLLYGIAVAAQWRYKWVQYTQDTLLGPPSGRARTVFC